MKVRAMPRKKKLASLCLAVACCSVGVWADQGRGNSGNGRHETVRDRDRGHDRDSYFERHGHTRLNIPKGHYPPPGECRIWHPGRPPGHQPPPMSCDRAKARVPPGAWIIRHPDNDPEHVHVVVYDERQPGSILVTGQFKIASGVFVRVVVNR
jgi:hypothetical protein